MKRAVIVHCWGGNPEYAWYPWVKARLEAEGYSVSVPAMPDTNAPQLDTWLSTLQEVIDTPDEGLVLIGHSLGTVAIMRYLQAMSDFEVVGQVIFAAAFTDELGFKELENFFQTPFNFPRIKAKSARGFVAIQSDNDPYVSWQYGHRLQAELGAKLVLKHHAGHMSGPLNGPDSVLELPEVIKEIV